MKHALLATCMLAVGPLLAGCHGHASGVPGQCSVPGATVGVATGDQVPTLHWKGYEAGSATLGTVFTEEFHDCDGKKGITALLVDTSAIWCGPCQSSAKDIHDNMQGEWAQKGIRVISLVAQDAFGGPASTDDALAWRNQFQLDDSAVAADPLFNFAPADQTTVGLPIEVVVDPRTMQIVDTQQGYTGHYSALTDLADQNTP